MTSTVPEIRPNLTIIAGRPGAGKTTLASKLAQRIHCPLVSRDAIKEGIVNTTGDKGSPGGSLAQDAYLTFFAVIELLLRNRVTLVAEGYLPWEKHIDTLNLLANINLIVCDVDIEIANARIMRRDLEDPYWDQFHNKPVDQKAMPSQNYLPPNLDVLTLIVDCSDGYTPSLEDIFRFAKCSM